MSIKQKLEDAGYDTSGMDDASLIKKLDDAGYDTSSLQTETTSATKMSLMEFTKQQLTRSGMQNTPIALGIKSADSDSTKQLGEDITVALASKGTNPNLAAAVGTSLQMLPDAVAAMGGGKVAKEVAKPIGTELNAIRKAVTPGAKAKVGRMIGEAEKLAGVKETVPTVSNYAKKLNLPARERSFADIVNSVRAKIKNGEKLDAQDLVDFKDLVKQQYGANKIAKGTKLDAMTAKANVEAGEALNSSVPGRVIPAKEYAKIAKYQKQLKLLAKAAGGTAGLGLAGALLTKLVK